MGIEIRHLHHVGHVVRDMRRGLDLYRRLGFDCPPPAYPVMSEPAGEPPRPFGAANTHAAFARNFVELATVVSDDAPIPDNASLVPIQVPPAALPKFLETLERTVATLASGLSRFEGLHILVLQTDDVAATAARFDQLGVRHSGANLVRRQIETRNGVRTAPVRFLEIDREPVPEGRLAIAENPAPDILRAQTRLDHPNGAIDLVESVLCVRDDDVDAFVARYARYVGRSVGTDDGARIFELEGSRVVIVPVSALQALLPGETPPALPAFVACAVGVRDLRVTVALLKANGLPVATSPAGGIFVPATSALGAAVIFRQSG